MRAKIRISAVAAAVLLFGIASYCQAALTISLSANKDLSTLSVGDDVDFTVKLNGLQSGEMLEYLTAVISFGPSGSFSGGIGTAGDIIPLLGLSNFSSDFGGGPSQSGLYENGIGSTLDITSDGVFFTFTLHAVAPTSPDPGTISYFLAAAFDVNPEDYDDLINSDEHPDLISVGQDSPFSFSITGNAAVPEPSSLVLFSLGLGTLGLVRARRGWRKVS